MIHLQSPDFFTFGYSSEMCHNLFDVRIQNKIRVHLKHATLFVSTHWMLIYSPKQNKQLYISNCSTPWRWRIKRAKRWWGRKQRKLCWSSWPSTRTSCSPFCRRAADKLFPATSSTRPGSAAAQELRLSAACCSPAHRPAVFILSCSVRLLFQAQCMKENCDSNQKKSNCCQ